MAEFTREEIEETVERWLEANKLAEKEGNWTKYLGSFYTDDAVYRWNIGPNEEFWARGRKEIEDIALGYQMEGFEDWVYTYDTIIIDEKQGYFLGIWRQVTPYKREDGTFYEVQGMGGSWFHYAGNGQWDWQRDFFDLGNTKDLFFELAGAGVLNKTIREKIHKQAKGELLPGHEYIRPPLGKMKKFKNFMAMVRIAISG